MAEGLLYLTSSDLQRLGLTIGRVADVLEEAFRHKAAGRVTSPPMTFFHRDGAPWFNSMVCWIAPLGYAGCKFQSGDSSNPARGLPSIQGLYLLCEGESGRMVALMDARWLTAIRTAAVGALFARRAAREGAKTLGILGCGLQGRLQLEAIKAEVPTITHCRAYDTVPALAETYRKDMTGRFGVEIEIVGGPEAAVRDADIVMTSGPITKARAPCIEADWLAQGCLFLSLDRDSYVTDEAIRSMDRIFSDDREALMHSKEHEGAFAAVKSVEADLAEISSTNKPLRSRPDERIAVFVNGLGIEDLAAAIETYKMACQKNVGKPLLAQFE
jgi:ornithine cyclodeaminase/alanine dehydrogenase-like protein (mu-crystallin family)